MPATTTVNATGNQDIDGILLNRKWAVSSFTFSFPTSASFYQAGSAPSGETTSNFEVLNTTQQNFVRNYVLPQFAAVANVTFSEITETSSVHADLRFAQSDAPSTAWAYYPATQAYGGDSWYNNSSGSYDNPVVGNYAGHTFLHEVGHAFGLAHGHEASNPFGALPAAHDSIEYSIMTYRTYVNGPLDGYTYGSASAPQTLMMLDIAALQYLYGANFNTQSGNTTYTWSSSTGRMSINGVQQAATAGNKIFMTLWDGGGTDTYDFSNYTTNLSVNLQPGSWSTVSSTQLANLGSGHSAAGNIANALQYNNDTRSLIENAIGGTGNDTIVGNAADNVLNGGAGNDVVYGGLGNDTIYGGIGDDVISAGGGSDVLFGDAGNDTVDFSFSNTGWSINLTTGQATAASQSSGMINFENVIGSSGNDTIVIGAGANLLTGGGGNDTFCCLPGSGADIITDFVAGVGSGRDKIDFSSFRGLDSLTSVLAAASQVGSDTVFDLGNGNTLRLSNVAKVNLVDANFVYGSPAPASGDVAPRDFDGNGYSDVLWRHDNGSIKLWTWNGSQISGDLSLGSVPVNWKILDTGDFNGDGRTGDLLWRNQNGVTSIWELNGNQVIGNYGAGTLSTDWRFQDTGDFNGDGKTDILWRHNDGSIKIWEINTTSGNVDLSLGSVPSNWQILGTGDFNGDGRSDLFWRNQNGITSIWELNGNQIIGNYGTGTLSTDWLFVDTGDFNGDGNSDVLWRHSDGSIKIWQLNGGLVSDLSLGSAPIDWKIVDTGDFNADGKSDLLWRQDGTGIATVWELDGSQVVGTRTLGTLSTDWHYVT